MDKATSISKVKTFFWNVLTAIIVALNVVAAMALIASAYAGTINPTTEPIAGVLPLVLPITAIVMLVVLVIDLIAWRRTAIFAGAVILICLPSILRVFPIHFSAHEPRDDNERSRSFKLLTMNVIDFKDLTEQYPDDVNPTMSFILRTDADVVCLQEVEYFCPLALTHVTQEQIDSLNTRYPYSVRQDNQMILSKYQVTPLDVRYENNSYGSGDLAAYRLNVYDQPITIFNVHLRSFQFTQKDKDVLKGLSHINRERISDARHSVLTKLENAAVDRARQADRMVQYIKHFGGTNVIVCGDFNDVPGCYTMRQLEDQDLKDVHGSIGLGYMHTYFHNRFYFCIDHVMYRGNIEPINIRRDKINLSDHYPLLTTFVVK